MDLLNDGYIFYIMMTFSIFLQNFYQFKDYFLWQPEFRLVGRVVSYNNIFKI